MIDRRASPGDLLVHRSLGLCAITVCLWSETSDTLRSMTVYSDDVISFGAVHASASKSRHSFLWWCNERG